MTRSSSEKVEYKKVEHDGPQCEVGKRPVCALTVMKGKNKENGPLGGYVFEFGAVLRVDLCSERSGEDKLSNRACKSIRSEPEAIIHSQGHTQLRMH